MTAVTYRPPPVRLSIAQGVNFHRELAIAYDRVTGAPFDFTGWTGVLNVVDEHETLVVAFATSGADGVISLDSNGGTNLDLAASHTAALVATVEVAGVIHAPLYGDLVLTSPDGDPFQTARAVVEITRSTA